MSRQGDARLHTLAADRCRFGNRRLHILLTREGVALVARTSLSGARVARELDALVMLRGRTTTIVSDNGTELTSHAMLRWQLETGIAWHYIQSDKPQ